MIVGLDHRESVLESKYPVIPQREAPESLKKTNKTVEI